MGTSTRFSVCHGIKQDHPHAYGDKSHTIAARPRPYRIIPTRMGTRLIFCVLSSDARDHPHAYGDKHLRCAFLDRQLGSSPRVWGQGCVTSVYPVAVGIIPTRMGTRPHKWQQNRQPKDHPHAYGDKREKPLLCVPAPGSSPRVWGQVFNFSTAKYEFRIIPTRMGTSLP